MAITDRSICSYNIVVEMPGLTAEATMKFNYLTNNSTRITADTTEARLERISQSFRFDPASRCLNRPCELSELMTREAWPWLKR